MIEALAVLGAVAVATGAVLTLALKALSAEHRAGDYKASNAANEARMTSLSSQLADVTSQLKIEQGRVNELDDLLASAAVAGPVDGSFDRMLQKWEASRAERRDDLPVVHPPARADDRLDDRLLEPGE